MATRVKQIALKDLDSAVSRAIDSVNLSKGLKLKGPIINGIICKVDTLKGLQPAAVARQITAGVSPSIKDMRLTPKVTIEGGWITMGFIAKDIVVKPQL